MEQQLSFDFFIEERPKEDQYDLLERFFKDILKCDNLMQGIDKCGNRLAFMQQFNQWKNKQ